MPAKPHLYPYQVIILYESQFRCLGALLTPNYVITAAHCSHEFEPFNGTVKIGKYYRTKLESGEETFSIAEIKIHPQFSFSFEGNTI